MDPIFFSQFAPLVVIVAGIAIGGWVLTTWMRVKNGYPLDGAWGQSVYPRSDAEAAERVKLVSAENAQLRAELSAVKERLAAVERIVTDGSYRLDREIEGLRAKAN